MSSGDESGKVWQLGTYTKEDRIAEQYRDDQRAKAKAMDDAYNRSRPLPTYTGRGPSTNLAFTLLSLGVAAYLLYSTSIGTYTPQALGFPNFTLLAVFLALGFLGMFKKALFYLLAVYILYRFSLVWHPGETTQSLSSILGLLFEFPLLFSYPILCACALRSK